jgi:hypothetical protein
MHRGVNKSLPSSVGAAGYTASYKVDLMLDAVAAGVNCFWSRRAPGDCRASACELRILHHLRLACASCMCTAERHYESWKSGARLSGSVRWSADGRNCACCRLRATSSAAPAGTHRVCTGELSLHALDGEMRSALGIGFAALLPLHVAARMLTERRSPSLHLNRRKS